MHDPLFSVQNQVVLVSGASRGIGRAIAGGFAARSARVVITGRNEQTLKSTAEEIASADTPVLPLVCDVAHDRHRDLPASASAFMTGQILCVDGDFTCWMVLAHPRR